MRKIISFVLALILMIWMKSIKTFFRIPSERRGTEQKEGGTT